MKILRSIALLLVLALPFTVMAQDNRLQIVASHSILADVISNVAGDAADVSTLIPYGADPHSFQASPRDLTALADADVVFINGANFEEGLLETIEAVSDDTLIIEASLCVEMRSFESDHSDHDHSGDSSQMVDNPFITLEMCESYHNTAHGESEMHHEETHEDDTHDDEHEGDEAHNEEAHEDGEHEGDEEHHDDHAHDDAIGMMIALDCAEERCDPHVWFDVENVMLWSQTIRDVLITLDEANADTYSANTEAYLEALEDLETEIGTMIASIPEEARVLVTNHDSLGYLAGRYDFTVIETVIPGGSTLAEPSIGAIANVIDEVRANNVPAIFGDSTVRDAVVRQIAEETGAEVVTLYSGSLSEGEPAGTYLDYMRYNIGQIVDALSNE